MQRRSAILIFARSIEGISSKTTLYLKKALTKDMNWKWCNLFYRIFFSEKKNSILYTTVHLFFTEEWKAFRFEI